MKDAEIKKLKEKEQRADMENDDALSARVRAVDEVLAEAEASRVGLSEETRASDLSLPPKLRLRIS